MKNRFDFPCAALHLNEIQKVTGCVLLLGISYNSSDLLHRWGAAEDFDGRRLFSCHC